MADVVTRLKVESSEYDQKLSRATQQLQHMEKEVRRTGATFAYADKEELAFAQSLGAMETQATSANGKIAEMTKAFTELSLQYKHMTDEEKASPFGKAMSQSLDQLKGRIKDSKSELASIQGEMTSFGDVAQQIGGKLGLPVDQLMKFGPAGAAAAVALKVATDAFRQNEEAMDEWGRITEAAGSVYSGFINALNTGDFSGFFQNIRNIVTAAREAYDAMDQLGTFNAFNQVQVEGAKTGFTEAMADYREGTGSKEDVKAAAEKLKNELGQRQKKEQDAYIAAIKDLAEKRGVDAQMLQKALSGTYGDYETLRNTEMTGERIRPMGGGHAVKEKYAANETEKLGEALRKLNDEELARIQGLGAQAQRTATEVAQIDKQTARVLGGQKSSGVSYSRPTASVAKAEEKAPEGSIKAMREQLSGLQKDWEMATDDDSRTKLKEQIDEVTAALDKMLGKGAQVKQTVQVEGPSGYSQEGISALRGEIQGGMKSMQMGSSEYMVEAGRLVDLTTFENLLKATIERGVEIDPAVLEQNFENIDLGLDVTDETWQALTDTINEKLKDLGIDPIELDVKTGAVSDEPVKVAQATESGWKAAAEAVNTVGGALQQIEDPGAKVAGIIAQAIANIALSYAEAAASPAITGTGWGWLGFAAAGVATMIATIASIKQVTSGSYANGGIIPGNSYSGDNLTANVNAGELILNRAQQSNVASQLANSNPMGGLYLTTDISGNNLRIVLNNDNRSKGGSRNFYSKVH